MRAAVAGRDTLALMPTGSGKSLTYQLAAMLRPEPTLVLSPLIALMKDQVDKLPPQVAPTATFVNSSLSAEETAARLGEVRAGRKRLVYAAPERLRQARFLEMLRSIGVGLVVVDEVHCVSMWGHDFRPDYLFIRRALAELGEPTLLGMTATATPETARDVEPRPRARARPRLDHGRPAEPPLRRRGGRERGGPGANPRRPPARPRRRLRDRLRALAPLDGRARTRSQRARLPGGALPRGARVARAHARPGRVRRGSSAGRRRDHGLRDGHRQAGRAARLSRQLPRVARGVRPDGRARRARRRAE